MEIPMPDTTALGQVIVDRQALMPIGRSLHARFHELTKEEWDRENKSLAERFNLLRDEEMRLLEQIMGRPPMYGGFEIPVKCSLCRAIQPLGMPMHLRKSPCQKCVADEIQRKSSGAK